VAYQESVLVHVPSTGGEALTVQLGPGQSARFGRGAPGHLVDIPLDHPTVPRLAGEILAVDDHWRLTNFSSRHSYLVENPEGAGEYIRIPPRRVEAPVPFEFARVVLPSDGESVSFQVFAPQHVFMGPDEPGRLSGAETVSPFSLDENAKYFLVLVALCEPRLRGLSAVAVPSVPQVVERLRRHPECAEITRTAVNFHVDYLVGSKLRLRRPGGGERLDWKREALVSLVLRFGLVQEDHLALLPRRRPSERTA
jgi:hypothetical protein